MLRLLKILIETNLFISIAAIAFLWANIYILDLNNECFVILTLQVFFSTWFVYQISRWVYFKKGQYTNQEELVVQWFQKYPKFNEFTIYGSGIVTIILTCFLKWKTIAVLCFIGGISVLYPFQILKPFGITTRLRDFPFIKIFLIALVWSATSVILPATESAINFNERKDIYIVFFAQFIFILFITLPFDINDSKVDKTSDIKTIPSVFGVGTSKIICLILGVFYCFIMLYIMMIENWRSINSIYLSEWTICSIWILAILLQLYTFSKSENAPKWIIKIVYDGSMIIYFLVLLFTKIR